MLEKNKITQERWSQAQKWELSLWEATERKRGWKSPVWKIVRPFYGLFGLPGGRRDDYNYWWQKQFDGYGFLADSIDHYIELGCGPYTNTRLILKGRSTRYVVCSDPLIRNYIKYRGTWLYNAYRKGHIQLDPHPAEETPYRDELFDVVVMINVLDHVRDPGRCLENATRITRKGGFFLIGQELTNKEDLSKFPYDLGHPIRLDYEDLAPYLAAFTPVCNKLLSREEGRNPDAHYATLVFAGKRRMP